MLSKARRRAHRQLATTRVPNATTVTGGSGSVVTAGGSAMPGAVQPSSASQDNYRWWWNQWFYPYNYGYGYGYGYGWPYTYATYWPNYYVAPVVPAPVAPVVRPVAASYYPTWGYSSYWGYPNYWGYPYNTGYPYNYYAARPVVVSGAIQAEAAAA